MSVIFWGVSNLYFQTLIEYVLLLVCVKKLCANAVSNLNNGLDKAVFSDHFSISVQSNNVPCALCFHFPCLRRKDEIRHSNSAWLSRNETLLFSSTFLY